MEGHIRQRGKDPKNWSLVVELGRDPATGKRRQKWVAFRGNKRQAQEALAKLITQVRENTYVAPQTLTVSEYLDRWLVECEGANLRLSTLDHYRRMVDCHIRPALGQVRLDRLTAAHIQAFYADGRLPQVQALG